MGRILVLFITMLMLNGCAESVALLGTSIGGASNGKILQSSLNSAISYGVKKQTGKAPLEHVKAYAKKVNPKKITSIGLVAYGRDHEAELTIKEIEFIN